MTLTKLKKRLFDLLPIRRWIIQSKRLTLPGFYGVSLYDTVTFIYNELQKDNLTTRANSVAFSFFLSIFPLILFIIPILALTPGTTQYVSELDASIDGVIPLNTKQYLLQLIEDIKTHGSAGIQWTGIILAGFFASSGMQTLMNGFDKSYKTSFRSRSYIQKRLIAIGLTLLFTAIIATSVALIIAGQYTLSRLIDVFQLSIFTSVLFSILKWLIVLFLFYAIITFIYHYGPSTYRPLRLINPGATLATLLSVLTSVGFTYFINNFGRYNELYGAVGALIVLLLWLQINAFIILAGFELNASIIVNRDLTQQRIETNHP